MVLFILRVPGLFIMLFRRFRLREKIVLIVLGEELIRLSAILLLAMSHPVLTIHFLIGVIVIVFWIIIIVVISRLVIIRILFMCTLLVLLVLYVSLKALLLVVAILFIGIWRIWGIPLLTISKGLFILILTVIMVFMFIVVLILVFVSIISILRLIAVMGPRILSVV